MRANPSPADLSISQTDDPLPLAGNGIVLRRLTTADLTAFQAYRCNADVGRYQGWTATSDAQAISFLAEMNSATLFEPGKWCQIAIADTGTLELIGDIGLWVSEDEQNAEIGFTLSPLRQGRGIATDAVRLAVQIVFEQTKAMQVQGIADARNVPSLRLLERIGMRRVETRSAMFRDEPCIEYVYTISRDEMQASDTVPKPQNQL